MTRNGGSRASVVSEDQIAREIKPSLAYVVSYESGLDGRISAHVSIPTSKV